MTYLPALDRVDQDLRAHMAWEESPEVEFSPADMFRSALSNDADQLFELFTNMDCAEELLSRWYYASTPERRVDAGMRMRIALSDEIDRAAERVSSTEPNGSESDGKD